MKNKLVMIVLGVILVLAAGAMVYAIYSTQSGKEVFAEDGYIIVYDESNTEQPAKTYHFTEGTAFKRSYEGSIQFRDTEGNTVTADANSFVHYDSGASASLSKSVLVNLDEVGSSAVNYYGLNSDTSVNRSGSSYSIDTSENSSVDLTNYLWKVGNNRYMMVSDVITVSFADGESYSFDDYVELIYQEGGMVSIINGDTMLRDASKNTYVSTDTGIKINLATQVVLDNDNIAMTLGQMTTDSDQVVSVLPADVDELKIIIPEFKFTVFDGKDGEAGPDGANGQNGADGSVGSDGMSGDNGRTGLMGYDGDDGDAGQAGTSGRSGVNGVEGAEGVDGAQGASGAAGPQGGQGAAGSAGGAGGAGASGPSGSDGLEGEDGDDGTDGTSVKINNPLDVLKDVPYIYWSDALTATYDEIKGSFGFKMSVDSQATAIIKDVKVTVVDLATGKVVNTPQEIGSDMTAGGTSNTANIEGFDNLAPANAYRVTITGVYDYKGKPVETVFDDRTVVTDSFPLGVNVYGVEPLAIDIELVNRDADAKPGDTNNTHNYTVEWALTDANGASVKTGSTTLSQNFTSGVNPTVINADGTTSDHIIINTFDSTPLKADTQYYFSVTKLQNSTKIPERYIRIPVKTLKTTPSISNVEASVSVIDQSFVFSVGTVVDPDHAITGFRYEVTDMSGKVVAVVHAPDNRMVHCYVDGVDPQTGLGLDPNEFYYVRAIAEAFDNKKNIEVTCDFGTSITMDGVTQATWFTLNNMDRALTPNALGVGSGSVENAQFSIHLPGRAQIKPQSSLIITYHTNPINMGSQKIDWSVFSAGEGTGDQQEKIYTFTCNFGNLKSSNTYKFDCQGEVDINGDGHYENILIGSVMLTTPRYVNGSVVFAGQKNNTTPVYFTLTLQADSGASAEGTSVNTSSYAVSQAGSTSMIDGATNRGQVHVQLYTPGFNGGSDVLVCEGDFDLEIDSGSGDAKPLASKYTNRYITIDDFPGNASSTSFNGKYYAVVTGAYDSTSHKNKIPFAYTSEPIDVGKTYPDPSTLSLSVVPITINNYCEKVGVNALPEDVKNKNYDPQTVLGFHVTPVGIKNIDYFRDIYFYVYDAEYYRTTMLPIEQKLKPYMTGTDMTGMTSLSSESGNQHETGTKFYPVSDTHYMTALRIAFTKNDPGSTSGFTRMDAVPSAVFLFDDFIGDKTTCEAKLLDRNDDGANSGYDITPFVNDKAANYGFARGRDYEFTFRLKTDNRTMGDNDKMYPELLGPDKELVLKSNVTVLAPYEEPSYYFYPASSDENSFTYGYYVKSVDAALCLASNVSVNSGTVTNYDKTSGSQSKLYYNQDAKLTVSGARKGKYTVTTDCNLYVAGYNRSEPVVLINKFFAGKKPETKGSYTTIVGEDEKALSKVRFEIECESEDMTRNIVALKASFYKVGNDNGIINSTKKELYLSVSSISGRNITAYANFADLTSVANTGEKVRTYLEAYYDTGAEGLLLEEGSAYVYPSDFTNPTYVAIKEATSENEGQYIIPIGSSNAEFETRRDQSTDRKALGSIFKVAMDHTAAGAQGYNIKDTLTDTNLNPGVINFRLRHLSNNSWGYDTAANSRAKLGGAYDFVITKNLEPYTISRVKLSDQLNGSANEDREFTMGAVIPMVNLHSDRGYTISSGIHSSTVTFKISGVKGAGTMYVDSPATTPNYGAVYLILYQVESTPSGVIYTPMIDPATGKIRRFKTELTYDSIAGAPGDGEYTVTVGSNEATEFQLEPNSSYVFQMVYYETVEDYTKDLDSSTNPVTDHRTYLRDEKYPDSPADGVYYPINTTDTVAVAENLSRVSYSAKGYNDKRLTVNVELTNTSSKVQEGVTEFRYALYDDQNNLVLTHKEIEQWIRESEIGGSVVLNVSPKTFRVGQKLTDGVVKDVYLNFTKNGDGAIGKYKLRLIPVAISDLDTYDSFMAGRGFGNGATDDYSLVGDTHLTHTDLYMNAYNDWVKTYSLGNDRGYDGVSRATFVSFSELDNLKSSFPNIRAYSGETSVMFRIGMVDTDGVVHSDKYKIRIFNASGEDITTTEVRNQLYSSRTTQKITVSGLANDQTVTLKLYYVEDLTSNRGTGINHYGDADFDNGSTEATHIQNKDFKMTSATQKSTGSDGFSYGVIDAVRKGSQTSAFLDFVNPSKLNLVTKMDINIALGGAIKKSITVDHPFSSDSIQAGVTTVVNGDDTIFRYNGIPEGTFTDTGTYVIAIRMYMDGGTTKEYVIDNYTIA